MPGKGLVLLEKGFTAQAQNRTELQGKGDIKKIGIRVYCSANSLNIVLDLRTYQSKPEIDGPIFGEEDIFTRQFFAVSF